MHISHNFIATKTCLSYEFLVVFGRCGFETEKVRDGTDWDGVWGGSGQNFSNSCGCGVGEDKNFKPTQDSMTYSIFSKLFVSP